MMISNHLGQSQCSAEFTQCSPGMLRLEEIQPFQPVKRLNKSYSWNSLNNWAHLILFWYRWEKKLNRSHTNQLTISIAQPKIN